MPTFDGKSEKFELFENLFQKGLKIHIQLTEACKIKYFHSFMRGEALQTFRNTTSPSRESLGDILNAFRRQYLKLVSMATAKHKFQRLDFNPATQKLIDFIDELQKLAEDAFGVAAQVINEQFIYAKMPPHLKTSIHQVPLENATNEQIVSRFERELELKELEAPEELQTNTLTQQATQQNSKKSKPTCHHCKNQVTMETSAVNSNGRKTKPKTTRILPTLTTMILVVRETQIPTTKFLRCQSEQNKQSKKSENLHRSTHPVRPVVKLTIPKREKLRKRL